MKKYKIQKNYAVRLSDSHAIAAAFCSAAFFEGWGELSYVVLVPSANLTVTVDTKPLISALAMVLNVGRGNLCFCKYSWSKFLYETAISNKIIVHYGV